MTAIRDTYRKFLQLADLLDLRIRTGVIQAGKPFMDRAAICEEFSISPVTAHKIQQELVRRKLLLPRRGQSFIVCDPEKLGEIPLREIRLLRQIPTIDRDPIMDSISAGARSVAEKHRLEFRETYLELLDRNARKINPAGDCEPGQGMILLPYRSIMVRGAGFFLKWWNLRVTIDCPMPGTAGVIMDTMDGAEQLMGELKKAGAESVMVIPNRPNTWNPLLDAEILRYTKIFAGRLGLRYTCDLSANVKNLTRKIRNERPDALLFAATHRQEPFFESLLDKCPYRPLLYGFAQNDSPELPEFTVYRTDYTDLGRAAAELLFESSSAGPNVLLHYIPGKLIKKKMKDER